MASSKVLIKCFDDQEYLNNVVVALTLDVSHVVFVHHLEDDLASFKNTKEVLQNRKNIKVDIIRLNEDEKELRTLFEKYEDVIVDVSAVRYLSMMLFEKAIEFNREVIYYDYKENVIKNFQDHHIVAKDLARLKIEEIIHLASGTIKNKMHVEPNLEDEDTCDIIVNTVEHSLRQYPSFITYIQKINQIVTHSKQVKDGYLLSDENLKRIKSDHFYKEYDAFNLFKIDDRLLTFKNRYIESLFEVSGSFLEAYIYIQIMKSGLFDECKMSVIIDFSSEKYTRYPIVCEIDMIAIQNNSMIMISCKSNKIETDDLNEIKTHQERFGNTLSFPCICTIEDLNEKSPSIYNKAKGLKIAVVDQTAFLNRDVANTIYSMIDGKYIYEDLPR